jgi:hypothetical protein
MRVKGQAEFALILGLLVIAVVVGLYAYTTAAPPSIRPSAMTENQKAVASYVGDLIREAATSTISEMYRNGGYLDSSTPPLGTVSHVALGNDIAFWQMCSNYRVPDMEAEFASGVKKYIESKIQNSQAIEGNAVSFGKPSLAVNTKLYDNKVTLTVNLPTVLEGQSLPQPYVIDVSTKMGRIYDFSKNFARMQADCRVFDNNLLQSLMQSNENSRPCWIPIVGNANRAHTFTWKTLKDCMEIHVKYSLSKTILGKEYPVKDGKIQKWGLEFFPVPAVIDYSTVPAGSGVCTGGAAASSKKYDDLNVNFYFGDDDGLDRGDFSAPERLRIQPKVGPFMRFMGGIKAAEYSQTYSVVYPVIVNAWDSSMRKGFRFATLVYIDNNVIGECNAPVLSEARQNAYSRTYDDVCVERSTADANIAVKYDDGSDVIGATVSFYGCELGTTGGGSPIIAKVPPAWGALKVRDGQNEYVSCYSYKDLSSILITIPKSRHFKVNFSTVGISKSGSKYTIDSISASRERVNMGMVRAGDVCEPPEPEIIVNMNDAGLVVSNLDVANLPVAEYNVSVETYDGQNFRGFANMTGFRPSGSDIYVYSPSMNGFTASDLENVLRLYASCGMNPVSGAGYSGKVGCSWTG